MPGLGTRQVEDSTSNIEISKRVPKDRTVLRELRLQDFRCFSQLRLELPEEGAVFIGQNAQGKTSILEAVCVLVRLHSPRTHRMGKMIRMDQPGFGVAGEAWDTERQVRYAPGRGGGTLLKEDGEEVATSREYLHDGGLIVWMGNEDLELIRGGGEVRRHYLDFICSQMDPSYRRALSRYRRALKARNLLLKDRVLREAEIAAYTKILVNEGTLLQGVRSTVVAGLVDPAVNAQSAVSGRDEKISLEYAGNGFDMLEAAYEQAWDRELKQRQTVVGPHRDDLVLKINGLSAADYASEGQQRTAALALKLAQGHLLRERGGKMPLYLLDDIFGELDAQRRNALVDLLPQAAQKLITTTSVDWLKKDSDYPIFQVSAGAVTS